MPDLGSRIRGAVLGAAVGDALGAPVEFVYSFEELRQRWPPKGVTGYERWHSVGGTRFSPYTDDTELAEIVLRNLTASRRANLTLGETMKATAEDIAGWVVTPDQWRARGHACKAGANALRAGAHWSVAGGPTAGGCGSVMRAYPFGLAFHDDPERAITWSIEHSKMTHRDPIALAACAAMAAATVVAVIGGHVDSILDACVDAADRDDSKTAAMISEAITAGRSGVPVETTLQRLQGWAAHEAIAAAAYVVVRHPDNPRQALLEAANTPGDSDSIATLVGAILGARLGIEAFPVEWVRDVERSDELLVLADELTGLLE